jgi:hypothetical protein
MEALDVVAGDPRDRFFRSIDRPPIRMAFEHELVECLRRDPPRVVFLALDLADQLHANALELGLGKCGVEQDIGQQLEPKLQVFLENPSRGRREVLSRSGPQGAADKFDLIRDLACGPAGGALVQQARDEVRQAGLLERVLCRASLDQRMDLDDGQ